MKHIITRIILIIAVMLPVTIKAQSKLQVTGIVTDSATQKPLDYITVTLKTDKNVILKATLTKDDGVFTFSGISPVKYLVTLSAVGYQSKSLPVDMTNGTSNNLGAILMSSQSKQLKGVAITADKPIVKQEIDRISYDLQADPESKVSSVLEMLRKVPYVTLDANDNILLNGNSSYKILINGKPSGMMERDPINI